MITFNQLSEIIEGEELHYFKDTIIQYFITDSRKVIGQIEKAVFLAHQGPSHDGHQYIKELYDEGIRNFIVEKRNLNLNINDANFFYTPSTLRAIQDIVAFHRAKFNIQVIGITGSNGKTIVKEWLQQLLSVNYRIVATPHSYNSQLGVPLSVWQMDEHHDLGIFEAGISTTGEMQPLEKIIKPTLGIITNIGPAHDTGFTDIHEKTKEKLSLFIDAKYLIYCKDHVIIDEIVRNGKYGFKTFTWGYSDSSHLRILSRRKRKSSYLLMLQYDGNKFDIGLPVTDPASLENLIHCISCMLLLHYNVEEIKERVRNISSISMRLELKKGLNGSYIIDDSYTNDLGGLKIALDFLKQQKQRKRKTVILSDIAQASKNSTELYKEVDHLLISHKVNRLIAIGPEISKFKKTFSADVFSFPSTSDFLKNFDINKFSEEMILVKGARAFAFERIVNKLQEKIHGTRLEINLGAITGNLNFYRSRLKRETKIMVMVKAFAYGSGMYEVANLLQYHKMDYLGVAYTDEGVSLRQNGIEIPIMIMNPSPEGYEKLLEFDLEPEVYGFQQLKSLNSFLLGRELRIHIKIDTGMHRLGFEQEQVGELIAYLKKNKHLKIASIFSHLAAADEFEHEEFSRNQAVTFQELSLRIMQELDINPLLHLINSPGIVRYPEYQFDMVRLGIGLYGIDPNGIAQQLLQPVSTLKTIVSQVREVSGGSSIGYGRKGKTESPKKVATIAIGYADGFSRSFSNGKGHVSIGGQRVPVIGNVCMDMTMVDVTGLEVEEDDDVVIFGQDPSINELAQWIDTIPYEILTNVSERVKRIYLYD